MKALRFLFLILLPAVVLMGWESDQADRSSAKVEQMEGVNIYSYSKPSGKYEFVGTVKLKFSGSSNPKDFVSSLVKKARKEYPSANGIIISPELDKGECIKLE